MGMFYLFMARNVCGLLSHLLAVAFVSTRNSKRFIIINTKPPSHITWYSVSAVLGY